MTLLPPLLFFLFFFSGRVRHPFHSDLSPIIKPPVIKLLKLTKMKVQQLFIILVIFPLHPWLCLQVLLFFYICVLFVLPRKG